MRCPSPLPWFVATTEAPGMTEPEASRTKPEICPESNCASVIVADTDNRNTTARILRNMISSQVIDLNQCRAHGCCGDESAAVVGKRSFSFFSRPKLAHAAPTGEG